MNSMTQALRKKMGKVADKLTGTRRIDNSADPTSALSMLRRKAMNKATPEQTRKAGSVGRGY